MKVKEYRKVIEAVEQHHTDNDADLLARLVNMTGLEPRALAREVGHINNICWQYNRICRLVGESSHDLR